MPGTDIAGGECTRNGVCCDAWPRHGKLDGDICYPLQGQGFEVLGSRVEGSRGQGSRVQKFGCTHRLCTGRARAVVGCACMCLVVCALRGECRGLTRSWSRHTKDLLCEIKSRQPHSWWCKLFGARDCVCFVLRCRVQR
eukprot:3681799-Rhodomonas_salina.3